MRAARLMLRRSGNWVDALDLAGPRGRTAPLGWLLLLAGLCAVATVGPMVADAQEGLQAARDDVRRLRRATHQQALREQPAGREGRDGVSHGRTSLDGGAGPSAAQQAGAMRLARRLSYPWMAVLSQTEAAAQAQHVALLSFGVDLASLDATGRNMDKEARKEIGEGAATDAGLLADVRLSAAVVDDDQALRWADAHGPRAQLLSRARLPVAVATREGTLAWRAQAVWRGGAP